MPPSAHPIISVFLRHRVAANLLMLIIILLGFLSLNRLNTQFLPNFDINVISVRVVWPGASAEDVENGVTTPLEQEFRNLDFLKEMTSTAARSLGIVTLEFKEHTDMSFALQQVNEFVSLVDLPQDIEPAEVQRVFRYDPVATIILSGSGVALDELRPYAHQFKRQLLSRGISKVNLIGVPEQEIAIEIDNYWMQSLKLSLQNIANAVRQRSQDAPAGILGKGDVGVELRSLDKRRTEMAFSQLPILSDSAGKRVELGHISDIQLRNETGGREIYYQGQPAVLLQLMRSANADTLHSAKLMSEWLEDTRAHLPPNLVLDTYDEFWQLVQDRINLLLKNGLGGLVLVILTLFLFLNRQIAFWVAVGIPISFLGALTILYLYGGSINMVSLFAFIMALGIIVDDAIVVGEDTMTHAQMGESPLMASEGGARRMFVPVLSSSLTTVAAFLPLILLSGQFGQILFEIPLVVITVIIASLIECFLVLPGHLHHSLKRLSSKTTQKAPGFFTQLFNDLRVYFDGRLEHFRTHQFKTIIHWALQHRLLTLLLILLLFVFAIMLVASGRIGFSFFPTPGGTSIIASIKFSAGTPPNRVKAFALRVEQALWQSNQILVDKYSMDKPIVRLATTQLNSATFTSGESFVSGEQYAMVQAELSQPDSRPATNQDVIEVWESLLNDTPGVEQLSISSPIGGPPGKDVDVFLSGSDGLTLKKAAMDLALTISKEPGVFNVQDDSPFGRDQLIFELTPTGHALGLTVTEVGQQLRAILEGQLVQRFYNQDEEIDVRVMLKPMERDRLSSLDNIPISVSTDEGLKTVPLNTVVRWSSRRGLDVLRHTDGSLGIHVTAEVDAERGNSNALIAHLKKGPLPELAKKYGVEYSFKGRRGDQVKMLNEMIIGAAVGLLLIYIILAWVFASYSWPFAVMCVIPFGLTGAIYGHWILGYDLSVISLFGFFGLSGIVVNDSIILISFYKKLHHAGVSVKDALIESTGARLRAVFLTSLTTIVGLLPLLFETSMQAQFLIPMAVSISFGLAFSTVLVLVVVPVLLASIEDVKSRLRFNANTSNSRPS